MMLGSTTTLARSFLRSCCRDFCCGWFSIVVVFWTGIKAREEIFPELRLKSSTFVAGGRKTRGVLSGRLDFALLT